MKDIIPVAIVAFMTGVASTLFFSIGYEARVNSEALFKAYNLGKKDALSTRPASWDLEMSCASLWASKLPHKPENH